MVVLKHWRKFKPHASSVSGPQFTVKAFASLACIKQAVNVWEQKINNKNLLGFLHNWKFSDIVLQKTAALFRLICIIEKKQHYQERALSSLLHHLIPRANSRDTTERGTLRKTRAQKRKTRWVVLVRAQRCKYTLKCKTETGRESRMTREIRWAEKPTHLTEKNKMREGKRARRNRQFVEGGRKTGLREDKVI